MPHRSKSISLTRSSSDSSSLPCRRYRRSPVVLFLLLLLWSIVLGWALSQATMASNLGGAIAQTNPRVEDLAPPPTAIGTVDPIPSKYQLGYELYLENCATCHIGVPPAVLPTETWRQLLQDSQHYGVQINPLVDPGRLLVWDYLRTFSRPLMAEESVPYRMGQSRYFKALHPRVDLSPTVKLSSCATCHPAAAQFNYRSLSPEWENAP